MTWTALAVIVLGVAVCLLGVSVITLARTVGALVKRIAALEARPRVRAFGETDRAVYDAGRLGPWPRR